MGGENLEFWDGLPLAKGGSQIAGHNSGNKGPIWKTKCNLFSGGVTGERQIQRVLLWTNCLPEKWVPWWALTAYRFRI